MITTIGDARDTIKDFEALDPGETFMYEGKLYIKLTDNENECGGYNVYNLHKDYLDYFCPDIPVAKVDVELFIVG